MEHFLVEEVCANIGVYLCGAEREREAKGKLLLNVFT